MSPTINRDIVTLEAHNVIKRNLMCLLGSRIDVNWHAPHLRVAANIPRDVFAIPHALGEVPGWEVSSEARKLRGKIPNNPKHEIVQNEMPSHPKLPAGLQ